MEITGKREHFIWTWVIHRHSVGEKNEEFGNKEEGPAGSKARGGGQPMSVGENMVGIDGILLFDKQWGAIKGLRAEVYHYGMEQ